MKTLIHTFILLLFTSITSNSQTLVHHDAMISIDGEMVQTIEIKLDPKKETVKDNFAEWIEDNYSVDLDDRKWLFFDKEFLSAEGVVVPTISNRKIDLKAKVRESEKGITTMNVFASFGYNNWITDRDHPSEFAALRGIVYEFVEEYLPEYYIEQIEDQKDKVKDLTNTQEDYQKDFVDNQKKIEDLRAENEELSMKLRENQRKINMAKYSLKTKNQAYDEIIDRTSDLK